MVRDGRLDRTLMIVGVVGGVMLTAIGVRFLADPVNAATFFGIDQRDLGHHLHHAVALRDLWLGLMAIAFAMLKDWRALALWFGLGMLICFGDAFIAASASGRWVSVTFHSVSGVVCAVLGLLFAKRWLEVARAAD